MLLASRYRNLPIKYKLRMIILFTLSTALVVAFAGNLAYDEVSRRAAMRDDLEILAAMLGANSTAALTFNDADAARELLYGLRARPHVTAGFLYDSDGRPFAGYRRTPVSNGEAPRVRPAQTRFEGDRLAVFQDVLLNGRRIGTVYLESDLAGLHEARRRAVWIVVTILLGTLGLAMALFSRLQRVISEPIARLDGLARRVSDHRDYSIRGVKSADDELGRLTDTFNGMLSQIESNREDLEGQVAERTAELSAALDQAEAAGQALVASEERFRIAAENASDMIVECDLHSGEISTFGLRADRFAGQPVEGTVAAWRSMLHPEDTERLLREIREHIRSGEPHQTQYRAVDRNGRVYTYCSRGQAIRGVDGKPSKWIGMLTDITESKAAEEAIAELAAIVKCSEDAIVGASPAGVITSWNGGAERLLGVTAAEALGSPISLLLSGPGQVETIFEPSTKGTVGRFEETLFVRRDGSEVPVSLTVSPIVQAGGGVTGVALIAHDIRARKKAETELAHQARHDHLTGLPNRALFADRLAASIARAGDSGGATAVIYIDLDGFKFVNDSLGHEVGDALLQQVTERLKRSIREPDTLARMGGDEFMLVVNDVPDDHVARSIAERFRGALRQPFAVAGHELYMTASMGVAMYPRDGSDVSTLRRNADAAMYEAKHSGKDRIHFFTPMLQASYQERLELENELRRAIDRNEFTLHYQPIFEALSGRQTAYEALLRWFHPSLGAIPPSKFVPVAEETGLIIRLGAWVQREACRQCREWQRRGLKGVRVAVNVSALEFAKTDFVEGVLASLERTGLPGELLELELTETMLMRDMEDSIRKMTRLRDLRIGSSIDDFGTGYSSLGYLPSLPVDALKIDRSFVADLGRSGKALPLIEGMISLAHSIGKRVVVEGVETHEQLDILREAGSDEIQGYLLGRPAKLPDWSRAPARDFETDLEAVPLPV